VLGLGGFQTCPWDIRDVRRPAILALVSETLSARVWCWRLTLPDRTGLLERVQVREFRTGAIRLGSHGCGLRLEMEASVSQPEWVLAYTLCRVKTIRIAASSVMDTPAFCSLISILGFLPPPLLNL